MVELASIPKKKKTIKKGRVCVRMGGRGGYDIASSHTCVLTEV